jgi:hypothetical protein
MTRVPFGGRRCGPMASIFPFSHQNRRPVDGMFAIEYAYVLNQEIFGASQR